MQLINIDLIGDNLEKDFLIIQRKLTCIYRLII